MQTKLIAIIALCLLIGACASSNPMSHESLQAAYMERAKATCDYETKGDVALYHKCMKAKGAE